MTYILIYIASVVVSYFLFKYYIKKQDDWYKPYGMYVFMLFVPLYNILYPIAGIIIEWLLDKESDWKWFWGIKE